MLKSAWIKRKFSADIFYIIAINFELTSFSGHKTSCTARSPWVSCQASSFSFAVGIL